MITFSSHVTSKASGRAVNFVRGPKFWHPVHGLLTPMWLTFNHLWPVQW